MAEKTLKKVADQLNCSICLDTYTDPKLLRCHHVYCQNCLAKLVVNRGLPSVRCPKCRQVTVLSPVGVADLPPAFRINNILEIMEEHKKEAAERDSLCRFSCLEHDGREVELYCKTCVEFICCKCALKGSKHHSHSYEDLMRACEEEKQLAANKRHGEVSVPDPSKCFIITGKDVEVAGETSVFVLQICSVNGQPCKQPFHSSECELVSEIKGTVIKGTIKQAGPSSYRISYQPAIKGRHQLHVKVDGQHIRGSPFSTVVVSPSNKLGGSPLLTINELSLPRGVVVNQKGEVFISSSRANCISVFSPSGEKLRSFGTNGSAPGQFACPSGLAIDHEGNIYVADCYNNRIQKLTAEGQCLATVGKPLEFRGPDAIAFNVTNKKLYITENRRVQVLNFDLTFSSTFGTQGSDEGQFIFPRGIACDSDGNVYVTDYANHNVQVFTAEGRFLKIFREGDGSHQFNFSPVDIAIDSNNLVYISDYYHHDVTVYTPESVPIMSFGQCRDNFDDRLSGPRGICFDKGGVVYVCDRNNMRAHAF